MLIFFSKDIMCALVYTQAGFAPVHPNEFHGFCTTHIGELMGTDGDHYFSIL